MYSTVPTTVEFKTKLGLNPYDPIMTISTNKNNESISKRIDFSKRVDLCFLKHKLVIEIDKIEQKDENKYKETERQKGNRKKS